MPGTPPHRRDGGGERLEAGLRRQGRKPGGAGGARGSPHGHDRPDRPDEFGKTLLVNLEHENVDVSAIGVDEHVGSGMSVAILQTDGNYGAVIVSGANLAIDPKALVDKWKALGGAQVLVLQNEVPHAVNVEMAAAARMAGAQVLFNAAPARDPGSDLLDHVDVLIVNRVEAEMLFGSPVVDRAAAVKVLSSATVRGSVVITLGGDGLVLRTTAGEVRAIAPVPVTVTSTHGAGDCFVGVLAREIARGSPLPEACETANRAAAAFVSRPSKT